MRLIGSKMLFIEEVKQLTGKDKVNEADSK